MADNLAGVGQALDVSLPTIHGKFLLLREAGKMLRQYATAFPLRPHTGSSALMINYNRATAQSLTDGVDLTQAFVLADTLSSYTPNEVGVKCFLPDTTARRISDPNLEGKISTILNDAYDFQEDADGCDEFVNFTTVLGSASDVISPGHVAAAVSRLELGNTRRVDSTNTRPEPPRSRKHVMLHPLHGVVLTGRLMPLTDVPTGTSVYGVNTGAHAGETVGVGNSQASLDLFRQGLTAIGQVAGVTVRTEPNINVDGSDDASSAVYAEEGLIWCEEMGPQAWKDRDDSARHTEIGMVGSYTWGTYRPQVNGIELLFDASMPTS